MYMSGSGTIEPGSATAIIDMAPLPPRATTPRPSSGVEGEVDVRAARADGAPGLELAVVGRPRWRCGR